MEEAYLRRQSAVISKIIILGNAQVGKSSIMLRFNEDIFCPTQMTVGLDYKFKTIDIDGKKVKLQLWDTPGQTKYYDIAKTLFKTPEGVIFTYACDDRNSFNALEKYMKDIDATSRKDVCKIIVGDKKDVSGRQVTTDDGRLLAEAFGMHFIETSAKTGENIAEVFRILAKETLKRAPMRPMAVSISLTSVAETTNTNQTSRCC